MSIPTSPVKWAIGSYISSYSSIRGENYEKNLLNHPKYTIIWANIIELMQKTDPSQRLNLTENGGPNAKKGHIEFLKRIALKGESMVPAGIGINAQGFIMFDNSRHRIVTCYLLGGQKVPLIVKLSELDKLKKMIRCQEITRFTLSGLNELAVYFEPL